MAKRLVRWRDAIGHRPAASESVLFKVLWQTKELPYTIIDQRAWVDLADVEALFDVRSVPVYHAAERGPLARKGTEAAA